MDAISKIHEFLRFGSVLGLERMNVLLEKLGNPQEELKVIHVAGTNGKGSICRYIYEVLQTAGYKCGLYTSPFLEVFNERIEFDGVYITDEELELYTKDVLAKAEEMVQEGLESPTEFEVVTAIAFVYFAKKQADYVILEVGLGGRGDSTNVVKQPLCSIIASISLDHTDRLGETISEIAFEKAGIIKSGCPVITGTDRKDAMEVFQSKSLELGCELFDTFKYPAEITEETLSGYKFRAEVFDKTYELEISMLGRHQIRNAMEALTALALLNRRGKISVSDDDIKTGFRKAKHIGRFEIIQENPFVIIDGAHNPDGSKALREAVTKHFEGKKILMAVGILADKEVGEVLDNFRAVTGDFVATEPNNPRKLDASALAVLIEEKGGNCVVKSSPKDAVDYVKSQYDNYDLILFTGSLYLIGEIRGYLRA